MMSVNLLAGILFFFGALSNVSAMSNSFQTLQQLLDSDGGSEVKLAMQSYNVHSQNSQLPEIALYYSVLFNQIDYAQALAEAGTYVGKRRGVVTESPLLLVFNTFDNKAAQSRYVSFFIKSIEMSLRKEFFDDSYSKEKISSEFLKIKPTCDQQSEKYYCALWSRLMYATYYGHCDVILYFINHPADFPQNDFGVDEWWQTVTRLAVFHKNKDIIDILIDADIMRETKIYRSKNSFCPIC